MGLGKLVRYIEVLFLGPFPYITLIYYWPEKMISFVIPSERYFVIMRFVKSKFHCICLLLAKVISIVIQLTSGKIAGKWR